MEDKTFELLTQMYAEMQEIKSNMATKQDLDELRSRTASKQDLEELRSNMASKQDLDELRSSMATKQTIARLEIKMDKHFNALYDGYESTYEKLTLLEDKVDKLSKKVDKHDVEIRVIKGNKKTRTK